MTLPRPQLPLSARGGGISTCLSWSLVLQLEQHSSSWSWEREPSWPAGLTTEALQAGSPSHHGAGACTPDPEPARPGLSTGILDTRVLPSPWSRGPDVPHTKSSRCGAPGWLSGCASAFGSGYDPGPGVPGSSPASGSLHGACFSLCLCLSLSLRNK